MPLVNNAGADDEICDTGTYTLQAGSIAVGSIGAWAGAGVIFADPNDPNTIVSDLAEGDNILTWTVTGGTCADGVDEVVITKYLTQVALPGPDQTGCNTASFSLAATAPSKGTGKWTSSNPQVVFADATLPASSVTGLVNGFNGFTWTTTNGTCTDSKDMTITLIETPTANVGPDAILCDDNELQLSASSTGSGFWTSSGVGVIILSPLNSFTKATNIPEGVTTFTWILADNTCGLVTDEMSVTRSVTIVADAGQNIIACDITNATLNAAIPAKGAGLWTTTDPGVIIDDPTSPSTGISNLSGAAGFFWTVTNGSCVSTDNVTVSINPLPPVTAPPPITICAGTPVTLVASGASVYTWDNGAVDGREFIPTVTTTYTVIGVTAAGCSNTAQTTVTVNPIPVVDAGPDMEICEGESVTLTASGADSYLWSDGVVNGVSFIPTTTTTYTVIGASLSCLSSEQAITITVNPLPIITATPSYAAVCANVPAFELEGALPAGGVFSGSGIASDQRFDASLAGNGTHTITYTYADAITQCSSSATFDILVDPLPIVTVTVDQIICEGGTVTFVASGAEAYKWEGDSLNTESVSFIPAVGIFAQNVVGHDLLGCSSEAVGTTEIESQPNAGIDSTILDLVASLGGTPEIDGIWTDDDNSGANILDPSAADFNGVRHGDYNFTYLVSGFVCPDSSAVLGVEVDYVESNLIFSPSEGLSPNGDGINDTWFIADIEEFPNNNVKILSRTGATVFEISGYANDTNAFEGIANVSTIGTNELPSGTYFYVIDLGDGSEKVSGYFTLLK